MPIPDYTKRAQARYMEKKAQVHITLTPEEKMEIQKRAKDAGLSMTQYIIKKCIGDIYK